MKEQFTVEWDDFHREPTCQPNPDFPNGVDVDVTRGNVAKCKVDLPYPAKRCGVYVVRCNLCQYSMALTTAGRPDDPRPVTIPCHKLAGGTA